MKKGFRLLALCLVVLLALSLPLWSRSGPEPEPEPGPGMEEPPPIPSKYSEAPMFAALVAKGELPPVEKRLPDEPKVIPSVESIGKYGGEIRVFANAPHPGNDLQEPRHGANLYRIPRSGIGIEPDLAVGWEMDVDENSFTVFLRNGLKWSDGVPVTSEDFRFWRENMIGVVGGLWGSFGVTSVEVVDDLTVKLIKSGGIRGIEYQLSDWFGSDIMSFWPSHYLKEFHGDFNENAEKLAKDAGFAGWKEHFQDKIAFWPIKDPALPRVDPWILKQFGTSQKIYERNPYFWRVDPEGNQLPYIDRLIVTVVDPEVYHLKVSGGEADIAYVGTNLQNFSIYKTSAEANNCRVELYPGTMSSAYTLAFGIANPDLALRSVLNDVRFHQALSVAINREEMNKAVAFGLGTPGQASPLPSVSYYKEGWREHYAQYDPTLANKLLDEMGMNKRDKDGYRLRPDGQPFTFIIEFWHNRLIPAMELLVEYFDAVGVKTIMKQQDVNLWAERIGIGVAMVSMHAGDWYPWSTERGLLMNLGVWRDTGLHSGPWGDWWNDKQLAVQETLKEGEALPDKWWRVETPRDDELLGEKPPEHWIAQFELEQEFTNQEPASSRYVELGQKVFDYYLDRLIKIGTVGEIPKPMVVRKNLGNVPPPGYINGASLDNAFIQAFMDQFYWK